MKKFFCIFLIAVSLVTVVSSQEKAERDEKKWSTLTYYSVPLYRILQTRDAYVVIYGKNKAGAASTTIPKNWAKSSKDNPRKLMFRSVKGALQPYMTVVKDKGEFLRVILNVPPSRNVDFWGIANANKVTDIDKETLEELELN